MGNKRTVRVTLNVPEELLGRIKALAKKEELTVTEVFRRALETHLYLTKEERASSKILLKRAGQPIVEIVRPQ